MTESHPLEIELSRFSELENREEVERHLQRCSRCRRILADYGWVEGEITSLLEAEADAVPIPNPNWRAVHTELGRAERRSRGRERLVAAGAALVVCLMLGAPFVLGGEAHAQVVPASGLVTAPAPVSVENPVISTRPRSAGGRGAASDKTREGTVVSLPFVPIPTPPTPDG
jgi:anti-sigma factor RsiW